MTRPENLFEAASYDLKKFRERRMAERRLAPRETADRRVNQNGNGEVGQQDNQTDASKKESD
jgi:hypothetical protein